jgi:TolB-like protein
METQEVFSSEAINLELQRVLNFTLFKNSPALSRFLEYIVLEALNGRSTQIKEYTIAVNVIKRPSNFNGADDAIVRIHAGRLRRALSLYYATEGQSNQIYIDVPKGCYIPEFKSWGKSKVNNYSYKSLPAFHTNPTVAIFPFKCVSDGKEENVFALLLGEEVSAELSKFQDISVIGYYSMEMISKINQNIVEAGISVGADYIITGTIQFTEERIRTRINLLITTTGEVMMTKSLDKDIKCGMFEIQDEIVQSFIGAIGGYYGCIFQEIATASPIKASVNIKIREAIYAYYQYQRSFTVEYFKNAVKQLEEAVVQHPDNATAMAMLGELYLDGTVLAIETIEDPLEGGFRCSTEALKIDPLCQHAWQTLTWVYLFKKDKESCLRSAFRCIELNPNCSVMTCGVGFVLVCVGYFEEGFRMMEAGIKLNPYYPWWVNTGLSFYYIHTENYSTALYWAEKMNSEETFWDPLTKIVCFAHMNQLSAAKVELLKLQKLVPETQKQIRELIGSLLLSEDLVSQMVLGVEKAGLEVI